MVGSSNRMPGSPQGLLVPWHKATRLQRQTTKPTVHPSGDGVDRTTGRFEVRIARIRGEPSGPRLYLVFFSSTNFEAFEDYCELSL